MTIAAILAVAGAWLGLANPVFRLPFLILLLPAALAYVAVYAPTPRGAAKAAYWIGALSASASLYWTCLPIHNFGGIPWILALPVPILMGLVLGLYTAALALALRFGAKRLPPWLFVPYCAAAWTVMEMARGVLLTGFPWLTLAAAFSPWPVAIQGAAFIGAYGLSGLLAGLAAALAVYGPISRPGLTVMVLTMALFFLGNRRLDEPLAKDGATHVTIVQGNVDQSRKWAPEAEDETVTKYLDLSRQAIAQTPTDLLIWPETSMPFFYQDNGPLAKRIQDFVANAGAPLVFGAPAYERTIGGHILYNRAYFLAPSGETAAYDKEHLVPFGEYVPLGDFFPFIGKLVEGVGNFGPGHTGSPLAHGSLALGTLICYEAIFPELAQKRVAAGANLLVNISNDAWFGDSAAPHQHLDLTLLRAVEQGRSLIRGTNTGISAVIDPRGRIIAQGGLFTTLTLPCPEVPIMSETTWFHRHYTLVTWGIPVLFTILGLTALVLPVRRPEERAGSLTL
ncbi:apolipoprotein N-acyltransferase [Desulfovibrio sp. TomC]|uniref:apolipoprotein N-acyltransferase n=1 Tax=Desulfovibrio sp. TomC TaxID=1562888 RepID=UPI0005B79639|nr:apolipoprotein N-acyltransferase [Desulfovibrio sp. TomC]